MTADLIADGAAISSVNLSEVATVLVRHELDPAEILGPVQEQLDVVAFSADDALAAAALYPATAKHGLSLGDRACLALARRLKGPAVTAEHVWGRLALGIEVVMIRTARSG